MANELTGEIRSDFGKGASRRLRREGKTPAVVYGHGSAPIHVSIDSHELTKVLRHKATSLTLTVEGKNHNVAPRDIQIDPVRRFVEHVDLVVVTAAEAATIARDAADATAKAEASANAAAEGAKAKAEQRAARIASGESVEGADGSEQSANKAE